MSKVTSSHLFAIKRNKYFIKHRQYLPFSISIILIALVIAAPVLVVVGHIFIPAGEVWTHLVETVLPRYIQNSFILMVGVGFGVLIIGVSTAWVVSMCQFPAKRFFSWALLLPMAMPAYILAYVYTDFLQYSGPVQSTLRNWFEWSSKHDYWFPEIRSRGGAIAVLTLALYPYVYMLSRAIFLEQSASILEASRSLGRGAYTGFFQISLPLARPAIVAGVALALMETLGDFGTVDYFSVPTLTTGIYRWFNLGEKVTATQLSTCLLFFVLVLMVIERFSRRRSRFQKQPSSSRYRKLLTYNLKPWQQAMSLILCSLPLFFGFLLPAGLLLEMVLTNAGRSFNSDTWLYARNSISLASLTAILAVLISLILVYSVRLNPSKWNKVITRIAAIGYAVPGMVIAVGILMTLGFSYDFLEKSFGLEVGLFLGGSVFALIFAYLIRFLAVSHGGIEASLAKITTNMDDAARNFGYKALTILLKVHAPMLKGSLLTASLLVFVDAMKELPATLIVRPFNFDTLAVRVYRLASDERLIEASGSALAIVVAGLVPVILLSLAITRSRK